jgi:hypothetical protein
MKRIIAEYNKIYNHERSYAKATAQIDPICNLIDDYSLNKDVTLVLK